MYRAFYKTSIHQLRDLTYSQHFSTKSQDRIQRAIYDIETMFRALELKAKFYDAHQWDWFWKCGLAHPMQGMHIGYQFVLYVEEVTESLASFVSSCQPDASVRIYFGRGYSPLPEIFNQMSTLADCQVFESKKHAWIACARWQAIQMQALQHSKDAALSILSFLDTFHQSKSFDDFHEYLVLCGSRELAYTFESL